MAEESRMDLVAPDDGGTSPSPIALSPDYRPGTSVAGLARYSALAGMFLLAAFFAADMVRYWMVGRLQTPGAVGVAAQLQTADARLARVSGVALLAGAATTLAMIAWVRRMYRNLQPLGVRDLRFAPGWAVGGWFVPVLAWIRPKQIVDDVWRATEADAPYPCPPEWHRRRTPPWFEVWWATMVAAGLTGLYGLGLGSDPTRSQAVNDRYLALALALGAVLLMVALGMQFWLVGRTTERQRTRAVRLTGEPALAGSGAATDRFALAGVAIAAIAMAVFGLTSWKEPMALAERSATGFHYSDFGIEFDYPDGMTVTTEGVIGDTATETAGAALAASATDQSVGVVWVAGFGSVIDEGALTDLLNLSIDGIESESGGVVVRDDPTSTTIDGQPAIVVAIHVTVEVASAEGIVAAVGCASGSRFVEIIALGVGDVRPLFDTVAGSLHC